MADDIVVLLPYLLERYGLERYGLERLPIFD